MTVTLQELNALKNEVQMLKQQIELSNLQLTQSSAVQTALVTALKSQSQAQSELEKINAQGDFARLAGIKAGLDSVGQVKGKEGAITVTTGTSGALMLSLRGPMLRGIGTAAAEIADAVKKHNCKIFIGADTQIQSALQAGMTEASITQITDALKNATKSIQPQSIADGTPNAGEPQTEDFTVFSAIAAAGLFLNTVTGLEKFFRVDTAYAVHDAGEDAQQILLSMLQRFLTDKKVSFRNLAWISLPDIEREAAIAQTALAELKQQFDVGQLALAQAEKLKDETRPLQHLLDALKSTLIAGKGLLDALHPAIKQEGFWSYVQGRTMRELMLSEDGKFLPRLVVSAKAQTIQVLEDRSFRSDKIYGKSDIQIEFRLQSSSGEWIDSGISLTTFNAEDQDTSNSVYRFPSGGKQDKDR